MSSCTKYCVWNYWLIWAAALVLDAASVCRWCGFDLLFIHLPVCFGSCELHLIHGAVISQSLFFSMTCPRSFSPYPLLLTLSLPVCWPHPFIPINILCSLLLCFHRDGSLSFWEQDTESPKDLLHYYFPLLFHPSLHQYLSPRSLSLSFYLSWDYLSSAPPLSYFLFSFALFSVNGLISFYPGAQQD